MPKHFRNAVIQILRIVKQINIFTVQKIYRCLHRFNGAIKLSHKHLATSKHSQKIINGYSISMMMILAEF